MSGYSVIHQFGVNTDFENYQYFEVLVPAGTITLKDTTIITTTDTVIPVGVTTSGGTSGTMYLIGKKKPEAFRNADGTYPIK